MAQFPQYSVRKLVKGDGPLIARTWEAILPPVEGLLDWLPDLLDQLLHEETLVGGGVFTGNNNCAAFGISGFVDDATAEEYLQNPKAYLNLRLLQQCRDGKEALLGTIRQAVGNAGDGLNLVVLEYYQETFDFDDPWAHQLLNEIVPIYHSCHIGHNIKRSLHETEAALGHIQIAGGNREITAISPQHSHSLSSKGRGPRSVYGVSRDMPVATVTGIAKVLLFSKPPMLRLIPREQKVIKLAINGLTDVAIAEQLNISRDGVRKKWSAIFDHIEDVLPNFFEADETLSNTPKRGAEKRRRTLAFLSEHPAELRPHCLRR